MALGSSTVVAKHKHYLAQTGTRQPSFIKL